MFFQGDYNPIEKLLKNTKRDSTHLKYFKTFEDLYDSVVKKFNSYMQDASKVICAIQRMRFEAIWVRLNKKSAIRLSAAHSLSACHRYLQIKICFFLLLNRLWL